MCILSSRQDASLLFPLQCHGCAIVNLCDLRDSFTLVSGQHLSATLTGPQRGTLIYIDLEEGRRRKNHGKDHDFIYDSLSLGSRDNASKFLHGW